MEVGKKMKQNWLVIAVLFSGFILAGCGESAVASKELISAGTVTVAENVYDDQHSTVYLKVDEPKASEEDAAIASLITKKNKWEKQFPNKRIVAMSIVTGNADNEGHLIIIGLLVHYEQH